MLSDDRSQAAGIIDQSRMEDLTVFLLLCLYSHCSSQFLCLIPPLHQRHWMFFIVGIDRKRLHELFSPSQSDDSVVCDYSEETVNCRYSCVDFLLKVHSRLRCVLVFILSAWSFFDETASDIYFILDFYSGGLLDLS